METGFDGEYYYVQLDKEDLIRLRELVLKKGRILKICEGMSENDK